jgi:predicted ATP-binding protein involved in virulence
MQLDKLSITGLYGRFDHQIALKKLEKITIIHAPNGFGKTVILTLLNAFFSKQFGAFFRYQYKTISLAFDTGAEVEISKHERPLTAVKK